MTTGSIIANTSPRTKQSNNVSLHGFLIYSEKGITRAQDEDLQNIYYGQG